MNEKTNQAAAGADQACEDQTVYVLEGEPDEVFNAEGQRLHLTKEQEQEIEDQM